MAKETCHMAKETYYMAKETCHMAKETYYMAKETCHMAKETYHMAVHPICSILHCCCEIFMHTFICVYAISYDTRTV